jgi:cytochrome c oxidase cbb3-type subunit 3
MRFNNKISLITTAVMLCPGIMFAANASTGDSYGHYNMVLISLVGLMLILLFVIGMLANTLRQLTFVLQEKIRKERNTKSIVKTVLMLVAFSIPALPLSAVESYKGGHNATVSTSTAISGIAAVDFYVIMSVIALELLVIFALVIYIKILLGVISVRPERVRQAAHKVIRKNWFWDKFNAAVPMEKESGLLLDHNYDGIEELDNSLPPWWKYGFYLTIVVACIYIYRYHISNDGLSQQDEYAAEMQKGEDEKAVYLAQAGNNVNENNVTVLTDASEVAAGKDLFVKTCAACHLADGGGIVGPNLTDEYWLHGGSIKDIFKTIKYGWQDKGMKSWKDDYSPKQIQQLASFIKSLKGTKPLTPKAPQGDLYIEAGKASPAADTVKNSAGNSNKGKMASK